MTEALKALIADWDRVGCAKAKEAEDAWVVGYRHGKKIAAQELRVALATPAPAQPEGAQEDEPVAWPKLKKPATVGGGTFGVGVSARLVVESAQRHYEWAQEERDNPKTPEQRQDAEMSRRRLWDMLNGAPDAGATAPVEGAPSRDEIRREAFQEAAKEPRAYAEMLEKGGWGNRFPDELCAIFNASTNMAERIRALAAPTSPTPTPEADHG